MATLTFVPLIAIGEQSPGGTRADRPVGCMRGLGGRLWEQRLQTVRKLPQRGLSRDVVRSIGCPPHRLNVGRLEAERLVS